MSWQRGRIGFMAVALVGMVAGGAVADVTTEQGASILVFPKVISDGTRDTIIQISNTTNSMVHAHCFYVNGALTFPDQEPGPGNPPLCTEIDFDIWLTKQQPTYWVVSEGRLVNPDDDACSRGDLSCPGAGLDPGRIPPMVPDFVGELKCVEVDISGAPLSGNHLKGEATLVSTDACIIPLGETTGTCLLSGESCTSDCNSRFDVAKYNAIGILGKPENNGDNVLVLGGPSPEYNGCPQTWLLDHFAEGAIGPLSGTPDSQPDQGVHTDITVVPCTENFETQEPTSVTMQFAITNEYEQTFSTSTTVSCWAEHNLATIDQVFLRSAVGSDLLQTRIRPSSGTAGGFLVVADERHVNVDGIATTAAENLHLQGEVSAADLITIPADQLQQPN